MPRTTSEKTAAIAASHRVQVPRKPEFLVFLAGCLAIADGDEGDSGCTGGSGVPWACRCGKRLSVAHLGGLGITRSTFTALMPGH